MSTRTLVTVLRRRTVAFRVKMKQYNINYTEYIMSIIYRMHNHRGGNVLRTLIILHTSIKITIETHEPQFVNNHCFQNGLNYFFNVERGSNSFSFSILTLLMIYYIFKCLFI